VDADEIPCPAPHNAEEAIGGKCGHHWVESVAESAHRTNVDLVDAVKEVKWEGIADSIECILYDSGVIGKEKDERRSREPCDECHTHRAECSEA
jgi:hypothetical protein